MTYVTIGGVTVGLMILAHFVTTWWPGTKPLRKDPARHAAALLPFLLSWSYGALTVLGIGGLIGWAARTAVWVTSWLGDVPLVWGVGVDAGQRAGGTVYASEAPELASPSGDLLRLQDPLEKEWGLKDLQADLAVIRALQPALEAGAERSRDAAPAAGGAR